MVSPEFSYHCLEYRISSPWMLNPIEQRKWIPNYFFGRIGSFIFIKTYVPKLRCFFKKSTSEFSG
ncbi:hypothetical protein B2G50_03890 [Leptospira interrogans serovar Canicola]|nr:hypothetical protein B2G50_03890 [Leptospira interrogans serovar Canicola]